ncbi:hypothetical protein [Paenibacillus qinlingensis]|uniref:Uncharacterized protein n=1 Tax=Paenibacillus qinlingensis TaxID=1837343 RepID=A0ABU1P793_9BACL|nr:hypothetical protein [Paenibacillus qinlingensis]MDR6555424.1 hypothetical protein [Paenibacillus qinlingensis]
MNDAYTTPIRASLMQKDPTLKFEDITFDPNNQNVSVRGKYFTTSPRNYSGTTYTSPTQFENDWQKFSQPTQPVQPVTQPTQQPSQINYNNQFNDIFKQLQQQITGPQQPTNVYNTPQYQAYAAQSARRQNEGIRSAQEALGSSGFGRSSTLGERAGRIAGDEQQFLETQVVPQILAQQESQKQQQLQNLMGLLQPLFQQQQFGEQTAQNRAQLTGSFIPPEAQSAIDQILGLKRQAEQQGVTQDQLAGYRSQADTLRSQLQRLGIDPNFISADVTSTDVNTPAGLQTLEARQLDRRNFESDRQYEFAKGQQEWENNLKQDQFNENKAQQAWENAFKDKDFLQSVNDAAASRGLQWASLDQRSKEFVADQAFREKQFEFEKEQALNKAQTPNKNELEADYVSGFDGLTPDMRKKAFAENKAAIIKDLGKSGYDALYKSYFDEDGDPR